jgi:hypothetical protein
MTGTPKKGLFDTLYAAAAEVWDAAKKPLIKNKIRRKISASYDDAANKILECELKIQNTRKDFEHYDINVVLAEQQTIDRLKELQARIKAEHLTLFAKELATGEDDAE